MKQILLALSLFAILGAQGQMKPDSFSFYLSSKPLNLGAPHGDGPWQKLCDSLLHEAGYESDWGAIEQQGYGAWIDLLDSAFGFVNGTAKEPKDWEKHILRISCYRDNDIEIISLQDKIIAKGLRSGTILWVNKRGYEKALEYARRFALSKPWGDFQDAHISDTSHKWINLPNEALQSCDTCHVGTARMMVDLADTPRSATLIGRPDGTLAMPMDISSSAVQIWANKVRTMDSTSFRKLMDSINYDINSRLDTLKREQRELDSIKRRVSSLSIKLPNKPRTAPKKKEAKP